MINYNSNRLMLPSRFCSRNTGAGRHHEYKIMFGTATFMACFIFFAIFTIFNPHQVDLKRSAEVVDVADVTKNMFPAGIGLGPGPKQNDTTIPVLCSKGGRSEHCDIKGDIRIDPSSPTVYYVVPPDTNPLFIAGSYLNTLSSILTVKPYGRTDDAVAMGSVREWTVKMVVRNNPTVPSCSHVHHSPGVMFSFGGFSLNLFHAFADVIVPLFATARPFDRDVVLLVTDNQPWVASVHKTIMQALSRHNVVDINDEQKKGGITTHCFSSLTLGLKGRSKTELTINSSESTYTITDFRQFLKTAYNLKKTTAIKLQQSPTSSAASAAARPPRLLIISRNNTRTFTNVDEIAGACREVGFEVAVAEPYEDTRKYARVVNSCDVVVGVHGAGLANMVFMPEKAVLVQVVPLGLDRDSRDLFGEPCKGMNVRYLEYKIGKEESSLIERYPPDDDVLARPWVVEKRGVKVFRSIYFEGQNVKLDLRRFRPTLLKALELLHQ